MKSLTLLSTMALAAALSTLAIAPPAAAQNATTERSTTDLDRARELLAKGLDAFNAGKYEQARPVLVEAYKLSPSYDVAAALGQTELQLANYRDAAEHLAHSLRIFPPSESRDVRYKIEQGLKIAKVHVGALRVAVVPNGAAVRVDGAAVGSSPLASEVFLEPGSHTIEAQLGAGRPDRKVLDVLAGRDYALELTPTGPVSAAPNSGAAAPVAPEWSQAPSQRRSLVPVYIGAALTTVGLGTWLGFRIAAGNEKDHIKELKDGLGRTGCTDGTASADTCARIRNSYDEQRRFGTFSNVGLVVTLLAGTLTAAYAFWPNPPRNAAGLQMQPTVAVDRSGGSAFLSGSF